MRCYAMQVSNQIVTKTSLNFGIHKKYLILYTNIYSTVFFLSIYYIRIIFRKQTSNVAGMKKSVNFLFITIIEYQGK